MVVSIRSLGLTGIAGYEVGVECFCPADCRLSTWSACRMPPYANPANGCGRR